jgi:hypothetical protein
MPTAIEYGLTNHWHTQNGAGGGPPAASFAQNGAGSGPPSHNDASVAQLPIAPGMSSGEVLFAGPLVASLLVAAVVATVRHRRQNAADVRRVQLRSGRPPG